MGIVKKIFIVLILTLLIITTWAKETPEQKMDKLLELFRQFLITYIPEKISIKNFNDKIINKITKQERKKIILSVYNKDSSGENYVIKHNDIIKIVTAK